VTFPEVEIGMISNQSFARRLSISLEVQSSSKKLCAISGVKIIATWIGGQFPQGLKNPSILKKIDPALFQELVIDPLRRCYC